MRASHRNGKTPRRNSKCSQLQGRKNRNKIHRLTYNLRLSGPHERLLQALSVTKQPTLTCSAHTHATHRQVCGSSRCWCFASRVRSSSPSTSPASRASWPSTKYRKTRTCRWVASHLGEAAAEVSFAGEAVLCAVVNWLGFSVLRLAVVIVVFVVLDLRVFYLYFRPS